MTHRTAVRRLTPAIAILSLAVFSTTAHAFDTFTATGDLNVARGYGMSTVLKNGKVLFAGGATSQSAGPIASTELFDPATGKFTFTGSLSAARYRATSTLLRSGKVLIVGGFDDTSRLATAELYDPSTGLFTPTSGGLVTARDWSTATLLPNGKVLIAGGHDGSRRLASAELYDPTSNTFSSTGDMSARRERPMATLLPNGQVLVAGGYDGSNRLASAELYNPSTGKFTNTGSLATARFAASISLLGNGRVLIAGGVGVEAGVGLTSAEIYTPSTGKFTKTGSLHLARWHAATVVMPNGKVLIAGGYDGAGGGWATVETYNPSKGSFTQSYEHYDEVEGVLTTRGGLITGRYLASAALLPGGKVLLAGGYQDGGGLASAEIYNPTPPAPGKPTVKWGTNKKKRVVTATVNLVSGTSYSITAKLGRKTKTGKCKTKGAKVTCTLAPGKGRWSFAVTPKGAGGVGRSNSKAIKL